MRVFVNGGLRRIFWSKKGGLKGVDKTTKWRAYWYLFNTEYSSNDPIKAKFWKGHVERKGKCKDVYRYLVWISKG